MTQPYVSAVSPMVSTSKTMRYQQNEANATINGVSNDYFDVKGLVLKTAKPLINEVSVTVHKM